MKVEISGSCLCQSHQFTFEGTLKRFYLCHCSYCQKGTGSAHVANFFSYDGELNYRVSKSSVTFYKHLDTRHERNFCSECGSPLPTHNKEKNIFKIPAGCIDTDVEVLPDAHLFFGSRAKWDKDFDKVPKFDTYPEK